MTAFTVWKFEDPQGAAHASSLLEDAAHDGLVRIMDHAVVSWPVGAEHPTVKHTHDDTRRGLAWGVFWGLLFGMLFAVPVIGAAAGAAGGVLTKMRDGLGITDEQLDRIRDQVTEGTSALFLVTEQADLDRLGDRMRGVFTRLVDTNLTEAESSALRETFGGN
ncbi:DUF1269 domain-containing protein [Nocardioides panacis]|uniref:DUF1269 domain-containing protein n=1 Tax=Nocardioides panacis TaxID=2849501 RepID=A0A975SYN1_9ACTN|nr:DUF1269 domain-containing protein [Nocardioides panacis]QWZ08291.1 DUF1269 domain-containing protein [Nocardioides panacis]